MSPLDPGRHWLEAGITGLARQREWDAVATVEGPGSPGDEIEFLALRDGTLLVESGTPGVDVAPLAAALTGSLDPPYRAVAVRRPELWAVGACAIDVARLEPSPHGADLELTWDGSALTLVVDGMPTDSTAAAPLEALARARQAGPYAAHAHRLEGDRWEVLILPL